MQSKVSNNTISIPITVESKLLAPILVIKDSCRILNVKKETVSIESSIFDMNLIITRIGAHVNC